VLAPEGHAVRDAVAVAVGDRLEAGGLAVDVLDADAPLRVRVAPTEPSPPADGPGARR
jgi:hypothetical protein